MDGNKLENCIENNYNSIRFGNDWKIARSKKSRSICEYRIKHFSKVSSLSILFRKETFIFLEDKLFKYSAII